MAQVDISFINKIIYCSANPEGWTVFDLHFVYFIRNLSKNKGKYPNYYVVRQYFTYTYFGIL